MWEQLLGNIRQTVTHAIYHVALTAQPQTPPVRMPVGAIAGQGQPASGNNGARNQVLRENRPDQVAIPAARSADGRKIGRNDPCYCGSGKKYKRCHGLAA